MQKFLNKLLDLIGYTADGDVSVTKLFDDMWSIELPLGIIDGGVYEGEHWGDTHIEDTNATLVFTVGDLYDEGEFNFGEGMVKLNYADGNEGLAYTSELETVITDRIKDLYGIDAGGSEQGMQGDDYLSLDLWTKEVLDQTAYA